MKKVVTFGEVMVRLAPSENYRFTQVCPGSMDLTFGGAESSVAASISMLGGQSRFVSALPQHAVAEAFVRQMRGFNVDVEHVLRREDGRIGVYYVETGANQRPSRVIYDRDFSAVSICPGEEYDWDTIFADAQWLHISGITLAISETAARAAVMAADKAQAAGVKVSCDLNFRKNLWRWRPGTDARSLARGIMPEFLENVNVIIGNEEDAADVLDIHAGDTDVHAGSLEIAHYPDVARQIAQRFDKVEQVAITLRESISATHNNWGAMLYDVSSDNPSFAPMNDDQYQSYEIRNIVDRVGGGDSFAAGLIYAMTTPDFATTQDQVDFAVAASCLAHSIKGDFNYNSRDEVETLMRGNASGRVQR
jgi:2-dehydro-3-deoxygluconokinase